MQETNIPKEYIKETKFLSEIIDLPSGGTIYPPESPLSSGKIEIKYPTAREEDILTSKNLIQKGIVIDVFVKSLIVDKNINIEDLLIGDKSAILIAARIMAYGKDYPTEITCPKCGHINSEVIDLSMFSHKELDTKIAPVYSVKLPACKKEIEFKLLTGRDEKIIEAELKNYKKFTKSGPDIEITTRVKACIVSVDGNNDRDFIASFVTKELLSIDSIHLRKEMSRVSPDIDTKINFECEECSHSERINMPIGISFFWPSSEN